MKQVLFQLELKQLFLYVDTKTTKTRKRKEKKCFFVWYMIVWRNEQCEDFTFNI